MKKEIAEKWVKALRSGDYKQGVGKLRSEKNEFCCLGVLCNLHAQENPVFAAKQFDETRYGGQMDVVPEEVMMWSGLKTEIGNSPNLLYSLAELNDDGKTFNQIADIINGDWRSL